MSEKNEMDQSLDKKRANLFSYPRWVVLQLLEQCNLRCKMCYEWGEEGAYHEKKAMHQLDFEVVKKVIEDCAPVKPMYDFFGGEPLLYKRVDEVISLIKQYGSELVIPTNGTLVEKNAEMLVETGPDKVWISLDGPEEINDAQRGKGVFKKSIDGINKVLELRNRAGKKYPKIGITCIVTPDNHLNIEEFFLRCIDLKKLDHISIEMQLFLSQQQCKNYGDVLSNEFNIPHAPSAYARGMVWDKQKFELMNFPEMVRQINAVAQFCKSNDIFFFNYPKTITEQNLADYFSGNYTKMVDYKSNCRLPWMYTEITAKGDVASCHTYYDLTFGNVNETGIVDIWNSENYGKFRKYMKNNLLPICTACSRYYDYTI
ncbi:MAG: SPASM domain-containing protein [Chitinispirillaceae bacterium]|nr:SPASM domain-containing protein [Chitinispirillaceae bacterium]